MADNTYWSGSYWAGNYWGASYWSSYGTAVPTPPSRGGRALAPQLRPIRVVRVRRVYTLRPVYVKPFRRVYEFTFRVLVRQSWSVELAAPKLIGPAELYGLTLKKLRELDEFKKELTFRMEYLEKLLKLRLEANL